MPAEAIHTLQLTHRFGPVLAVDRLDLHVPVGSIYGFLGPNGAGKTTSIRALLGLIRPDSGEVRLFGESLAGNRTALLGRVGSLVEAPSLYPHLTGYENLQIKQKLAGLKRSEIDRALDIVRLRTDAHRVVRGYSLGMQQRLGLAKALMGQPELLILDEPTNGLDPAGMHELRDFIRRLPSEHGITVFLSSHLLGEVEQMATHVGIVGNGHVLFQGTLEELQGRTLERATLEVDRADAADAVLTHAGWTVARAIDSSLSVQLAVRNDSAEVVALLVRAGLQVYEVRLERPSLEELFLQLTKTFEHDRRAA
jgi:lantibiotic transport system ATP-binding protein